MPQTKAFIKTFTLLMLLPILILSLISCGPPPGPPPNGRPPSNDGPPLVAPQPSSTRTKEGLDPNCLGKDAAFKPFFDTLTVYCDDTYMYIDANSLAAHEMMVGITAWNQQVPLPQPFAGNNAWRIPLHPELADSTTETPGQGPMAVAINGVMIFNPTQQDGVYDVDHDPYLIGELDQCGGHAGRADDYHYHIAPLCVLAELATTNQNTDMPIAYALDGFPIYGYHTADGNTITDLDECGGKVDDTGAYRYYARENYPYVNGCFKGHFDQRLQPATHPIRPAGEPIRVLITAYYEDADGWIHLEYDYEGSLHSINYRLGDDGCYQFEFIDDINTNSGKQSQTYCGGR